MRIMNIFSDPSYLREGGRHVIMLYPFWGKNPEEPGSLDSGRFDRYVELGQSFFRMTTLAEADVAVLPAPWEDVIGDRKMRQLALQFAEQAKI